MKTVSKVPLPQYYTPDEVAASLGVTRRSVYEWLLNGSLKAGRAGRRWVITPQQVADFVAIRNAPQVPQVKQVSPGPTATKQTTSVPLRPMPTRKKGRR